MRNFILTLLSAALLSCGWLGLSGLPLMVAFVPLLIVVTGQERFWRAMGYVALALGLWSGVTTWWIAMVPGGWPAPVFSVLITITLFGAVLALFWTVRRRNEKLAWVVLVAGWIAAERFWMNGELSFPWLVLGNGFSNDAWAVQWYEMTGVFGGTLWVWLCNIAIYKKRWIAVAIVVLLPLAASTARYLAYDEKGEDRTAMVVQPNFFAYQKFETISESAQIDTMLNLSSRAPADIDFFVYPETAIDNRIEEDYMGRNPVIIRFRQLLKDKYPNAKMILGATTVRFYRPGERISYTARQTSGGMFYDYYNSALLIDTALQVEVHHKTKF